MGRQFTKNGADIQPWDGITERQRRLSAPLPDYPMKWLKRADALAQGYRPFAGFFLQHEYPLMAGFLLDLDRAKREYCGVRDLKNAKGIELFAKDGNKNFHPTQSTQASERSESYKTDLATEESIKAGIQEARTAESNLRETEAGVASGTSDMRSGDSWTMLESVLSVAPSSEST